MKEDENALHVPMLVNLDENDLAKAADTLHIDGVKGRIDIVNWPKEYPYAPTAEFNIGHSSTHIFIDFFVRGNSVRAFNSENNSRVHQDSCVEFFVEPTGDVPYYNFEFNCIGTIHGACRMDRHNGTPITDEVLNSVKRLSSLGNTPFEEREGLCAWNLTVAIPFSAMGIKYEGKSIEMRANFYKCGDLTAMPHFLSWAPINTPEPDFHRPEFFQSLIID